MASAAAFCLLLVLGSLSLPRALARPMAPGGRSLQDAECKRMVLYAWCGVSQETLADPSSPFDKKDFLVTIEATPESPNLGKVLNIESTPYSGTQPHHCGIDNTRKWLGAGGLVSLLVPAPDIFLFDLTNPRRPKYTTGLTAQQGACTDEFLPARSGGFYITNMCARNGGAGGGIAILSDPSSPALQEYTGDLSPADAATFTGHGIDVDYDAGGTGRIVTVDFVNVGSLIIPQGGSASPQFGHTARVWDLATKQVLQTVTFPALGSQLPGSTNGLMDARASPAGRGLFWVSSGLGHLHLLDAITYQVTPRVHCLNPDCSNIAGTCLMSGTFQNKQGAWRLLASSSALSQVRLLDITNPTQLTTLDILQLPTGAGAHVTKYDREHNIGAVSTYFVDQAGTVVRAASDKTIRLFTLDLKADKILPQAVVDMSTAVPAKGPSNCHGLAFNPAC